MSNCTQIRWQLNEFLAGSLTYHESEIVRLHLDRCNVCVRQLTQTARLERQLEIDRTKLAPDFTDRLLQSFPQTRPALAVVRSLAIVFAASSALAIGVFLVIHSLLERGVTGETAVAVETNALSTMFEQLLAAPAARYGLLAMAAVMLSVLVIVVIDLPRPHKAPQSSR
jgi:predicted anti-sigma-YlaC factor YlaD